MNTVERPGINPMWAKTVKSDYSPSQLKLDAENFERALVVLEYYVQHRELTPDFPPPPPGDRQPDRRRKALIGSYLVTWGLERLAILERQSVAKGVPFDTESAVRIFVAAYTAEMISFLLASKMKITLVPFIALGAVIGCTDEAFAVARLQLRAYRKGLYNWSDLNTMHRPALHFIMRLMADYFGEPSHVLRGESLTEPHYRALFDHWREPDTEVLAPYCLAACDAHTFRNCEFGEFMTRKHWKRTPIEILLLYKLRALLGLPNPALDHPLMNTPLGKLPPEIPFNTITRGPDDLVYRVRLTLKQDGYDEPAIFAEYKTDCEK